MCNSPADYFPTGYLQDVKTIGYAGTLCSMVIQKIDKGKIELQDPQAYLSTAYSMLVIDQGLYTYCPDSHFRWVSQAPKIPNYSGCSMRHGGMILPRDILRFVKLQPDRQNSFLEYFFNVYLPIIGISTEDLIRLKEKLKQDKDCLEIKALLSKM